jgi:hypothetical protein
MDVVDNAHIEEIFKFMCEPILAPLQEVYLLIIPEKLTASSLLDEQFARRIDEYSSFSRSRKKMLLDLVGYKPKNRKLVKYSLEELFALRDCSELATVPLHLDPYIQKGVPFSSEVTFNFIRCDEQQHSDERKRKKKKSAKKAEGRQKKRLKPSQPTQSDAPLVPLPPESNSLSV